MPSRDFDKEIGTQEREDPVHFKLFSTRWDCRDGVNGKLLMDRSADLDSGSLEQQRDGVVGIFKMCVVDEQIEDLLEMLDDPNREIELKDLINVISWLVEVYTERPTPQPAPSRGGQSSRGRTSTARPGAKA